MPEVKEVKKGLKAYAEFEFNGRKYKPGDEFIPPSNLTADTSYDEMIRSGLKDATQRGRAFFEEIKPRKKDEDSIVFRYVLPVE